MINTPTNNAFIKILNFIKIVNHIHINVIIVKILKNAVSLIMKYSALENIELIIRVKNIANTILMTL